MANVNANYLVRARYCRYVTMLLNHVSKAEIYHLFQKELVKKKALETGFDSQPVHISALNASLLNEG